VKVYATNPPSMVLIIDGPEMTDHLEFTVAPADTMTARIDMIYVKDGKVGAQKGQPIIIEGAPPADPDLHPDAKVIAQVMVPEAAKFIADAHITNFDNTPTGEMPKIPITHEAKQFIDGFAHALHNPNGGPGVTLVLDANDEFDSLLIPLVMLQRKKRADYASDEDIYGNFRANAKALDLPGYTALQDCLSMVTRKVGRIVNLRGKEPNNESVVDSFMDLAVYSILAYGLAIEAAEEAKPIAALEAAPTEEFAKSPSEAK